jgi:hypothetical protein
LKTRIPYILFAWLVYGCQSKASEDVVTHISEDSHIASAVPTTISWMNKMKNDLLQEYERQENYEAKSRVLKSYEQKMKKKIQHSFNNILDSIPVRVDDIDTTIKTIYYIRFSDAVANYSYSTSSGELKNNRKTLKLVQNLQEGAAATISFKVQSLKINDPASPLPTFDIEGIPMPLK